ncbi:MAG: hypothetical protein ABL940_07455, partial [Bacteroidia bacterium]
VLLGTVALFNMDNNAFSDLFFFIWLLTFPVTFISFAVVFTEQNPFTIVLVIQLLMLLPTFLIFLKLYNGKIKK